MSDPEKPARPSEESFFRRPDLDSEGRKTRADWVLKDVTRRLKRICEKLSDADFDALMLDITRKQLRGEGIYR